MWRPFARVARRCPGACGGCGLCAGQYLGERGLSGRHQPVDGGGDAVSGADACAFSWLRLSGVSLLLPKRDTLIAVLLGFITALYTWALLRSFNALPFALAVLTFYLFPLIAAVIVAAFGCTNLLGEPAPRSSLR